MEVVFKSCFVSYNHFNKNKGCQFCKNRLLDIRDKSKNEIDKEIASFKDGICVVAKYTQVRDYHSLKTRIIDTIQRAYRLHTGYKCIAYACLFVVLTIATSCKSRKPVAIGFAKVDSLE